MIQSHVVTRGVRDLLLLVNFCSVGPHELEDISAKRSHEIRSLHNRQMVYQVFSYSRCTAPRLILQHIDTNPELQALSRVFAFP